MVHFQLQNNGNHRELEEFHVLKEGADQDYDDITSLAAQLCKVPVAAIVVVENGKGWIKSVHGKVNKEYTLRPVLWKMVLEKGRIVTSKDLHKANSSCPFAFYAGVPLITAEGNKVGVLFVVDHEAGELQEEQRNSLEILVRQILHLVEYQKQNSKLRKVQRLSMQRYRELEKFSSVVSHDIKSPLANIISLTELLLEENRDKFDEETKQYLDYLAQSSYILRNYVDGILTFYRSEKILSKEQEDVELEKLFKNVVDLFQVGPDVEIQYPTSGTLHHVNKAALTQIFLNLLSNALKYNHKPKRKVEITFSEEENFYVFEVKDNGNGIPAVDFEKIFELFATLDQNDREGVPGSGIGLATVKKLLDHMGGSITVESTLNEGSNFKFKIQRF